MPVKKLRVNGEDKLLTVNSISELLKALKFSSQSIAVALNGELVQQELWQTTTLKNNDRIEIVMPMQGG